MSFFGSKFYHKRLTIKQRHTSYSKSLANADDSIKFSNLTYVVVLAQATVQKLMMCDAGAAVANAGIRGANVLGRGQTLSGIS